MGSAGDHRTTFLRLGADFRYLVNAPQRTRGEPEYWSTGLRVFEMVRIWLERLAELHCIHPHGHDPAKFWAAHTGWFNADAVRSNMIGSMYFPNVHVALVSAKILSFTILHRKHPCICL